MSGPPCSAISGSRCCRFTWGRRRIRPAPGPGLPTAAALRRRLPPAPGSARCRGDPGAARHSAHPPRPGPGPPRSPDMEPSRPLRPEPLVPPGNRVLFPRLVSRCGVTVRFAGGSRPALAMSCLRAAADRPRRRWSLGVGEVHSAQGGRGLAAAQRRPGAHRWDTRTGDSGSTRALLIGQHPYLFSGTLAENIALGQPGASRSRIWAAAEGRTAHQPARPLRWPGHGTWRGGWSVSAGEAQRVALARAFLSDARFVLIDDHGAPGRGHRGGTDRALARLLQGRTALVASHSDAVLGIAGRVIDLDGGRIRG